MTPGTKAILKVAVDRLPPSTNHAYRDRYGGGRVLTREGKEWKALVGWHTKATPPEAREILQGYVRQGRMLHVRVDYYLELLTKGGTVRRWDVNNYDKLLIDAIFDEIDIDDRFMASLLVHKHPLEAGGSEATVVTIGV